MRVGYKLRREIRDLLPGSCTPAERLVALEIADTAKEESRIALVSRSVLCARTGLTESGLKTALQRLLSRGLEFRRPHGNGKDGRPGYTMRGAEIEYRVPSLNEFAATCLPWEGDALASPSLNGHAVDKPP